MNRIGVMKNNIEQNGFETFFDYQNRNTHSRINKNPRKRNMMDNSFASSSFSSSSQLSSQVVNNAFFQITEGYDINFEWKFHLVLFLFYSYSKPTSIMAHLLIIHSVIYHLSKEVLEETERHVKVSGNKDDRHLEGTTCIHKSIIIRLIKQFKS